MKDSIIEELKKYKSEEQLKITTYLINELNQLLDMNENETSILINRINQINRLRLRNLIDISLIPLLLEIIMKIIKKYFFQKEILVELNIFNLLSNFLILKKKYNHPLLDKYHINSIDLYKIFRYFFINLYKNNDFNIFENFISLGNSFEEPIDNTIKENLTEIFIIKANILRTYINHDHNSIDFWFEETLFLYNHLLNVNQIYKIYDFIYIFTPIEVLLHKDFYILDMISSHLSMNQDLYLPFSKIIICLIKIYASLLNNKNNHILYEDSDKQMVISQLNLRINSYIQSWFQYYLSNIKQCHDKSKRKYFNYNYLYLSDKNTSYKKKIIENLNKITYDSFISKILIDYYLITNEECQKLINESILNELFGVMNSLIRENLCNTSILLSFIIGLFNHVFHMKFLKFYGLVGDSLEFTINHKYKLLIYTDNQQNEENNTLTSQMNINPEEYTRNINNMINIVLFLLENLQPIILKLFLFNSSSSTRVMKYFFSFYSLFIKNEISKYINNKLIERLNLQINKLTTFSIEILNYIKNNKGFPEYISHYNTFLNFLLSFLDYKNKLNQDKLLSFLKDELSSSYKSLFSINLPSFKNVILFYKHVFTYVCEESIMTKVKCSIHICLKSFIYDMIKSIVEMNNTVSSSTDLTILVSELYISIIKYQFIYDKDQLSIIEKFIFDKYFNLISEFLCDDNKKLVNTLSLLNISLYNIGLSLNKKTSHNQKFIKWLVNVLIDEKDGVEIEGLTNKERCVYMTTVIKNIKFEGDCVKYLKKLESIIRIYEFNACVNFSSIAMSVYSLLLNNTISFNLTVKNNKIEYDLVLVDDETFTVKMKFFIEQLEYYFSKLKSFIDNIDDNTTNLLSKEKSLLINLIQYLRLLFHDLYIIFYSQLSILKILSSTRNPYDYKIFIETMTKITTFNEEIKKIILNNKSLFTSIMNNEKVNYNHLDMSYLSSIFYAHKLNNKEYLSKLIQFEKENFTESTYYLHDIIVNSTYLMNINTNDYDILFQNQVFIQWKHFQYEYMLNKQINNYEDMILYYFINEYSPNPITSQVNIFDYIKTIFESNIISIKNLTIQIINENKLIKSQTCLQKLSNLLQVMTEMMSIVYYKKIRFSQDNNLFHYTAKVFILGFFILNHNKNIFPKIIQVVRSLLNRSIRAIYEIGLTDYFLIFNKRNSIEIEYNIRIKQNIVSLYENIKDIPNEKHNGRNRKRREYYTFIINLVKRLIKNFQITELDYNLSSDDYSFQSNNFDYSSNVELNEENFILIVEFLIDIDLFSVDIEEYSIEKSIDYDDNHVFCIEYIKLSNWVLNEIVSRQLSSQIKQSNKKLIENLLLKIFYKININSYIYNYSYISLNTNNNDYSILDLTFKYYPKFKNLSFYSDSHIKNKSFCIIHEEMKESYTKNIFRLACLDKFTDNEKLLSYLNYYINYYEDSIHNSKHGFDFSLSNSYLKYEVLKELFNLNKKIEVSLFNVIYSIQTIKNSSYACKKDNNYHIKLFCLYEYILGVLIDINNQINCFDLSNTNTINNIQSNILSLINFVYDDISHKTNSSIDSLIYNFLSKIHFLSNLYKTSFFISENEASTSKKMIPFWTSLFQTEEIKLEALIILDNPYFNIYITHLTENNVLSDMFIEYVNNMLKNLTSLNKNRINYSLFQKLLIHYLKLNGIISIDSRTDSVCVLNQTMFSQYLTQIKHVNEEDCLENKFFLYNIFNSQLLDSFSPTEFSLFLYDCSKLSYLEKSEKVYYLEDFLLSHINLVVTKERLDVFVNFSLNMIQVNRKALHKNSIYYILRTIFIIIISNSSLLDKNLFDKLIISFNNEQISEIKELYLNFLFKFLIYNTYYKSLLYSIIHFEENFLSNDSKVYILSAHFINQYSIFDLKVYEDIINWFYFLYKEKNNTINQLLSKYLVLFKENYTKTSHLLTNQLKESVKNNLDCLIFTRKNYYI